jgi:hypothetical protein
MRRCCAVFRCVSLCCGRDGLSGSLPALAAGPSSISHKLTWRVGRFSISAVSYQWSTLSLIGAGHGGGLGVGAFTVVEGVGVGGRAGALASFTVEEDNSASAALPGEDAEVAEHISLPKSIAVDAHGHGCPTGGTGYFAHTGLCLRSPGFANGSAAAGRTIYLQTK